MAWRELRVSDERRAFCELASLEGANVSELSRRFGISRQTGHLWLRRHAAGEQQFGDRSRRPHASPMRIGSGLEEAICAVRRAHPAWGARKIGAVLARQGTPPPAVSTVHAALSRNGLIPDEARRPQAFGRFEKPAPNDLWQMDFKGWERLACGTICHPLTVLDDHSRFALGLEACADQRLPTVRDRLIPIFRRHGLPLALYVDNGTPWGAGRPGQWTRLTVWLLKLGIRTIHGAPYHPQGRGKCERFHRSLRAEVFSMAPIHGLGGAQAAFARWRRLYNHERPHDALGLATPASRYRPSPRAYPERLPEPLYDQGETLRKVPATKQYLRFKGRLWAVPKAFAGETVAIRPNGQDGYYGVYFGAVEIARFSLKTPEQAPQRL